MLHAPGGGKQALTEKASHKTGYFVLPYRQVDQAIARVAQCALVEVVIPSEEGRSRDVMEQGNDVVVRHAGLAQLTSNLAHR